MAAPPILISKTMRRQRGTAYMLVLAITTLLITLGLTATQLAQDQIERGDIQSDQAKARLAALYMQDVIHKRNTGDLAWRDGLETETWYLQGAQDGVLLFYAFVDEIDGDLDDDYTEPFLLYTMGYAGATFRIYSVEYVSDSSGNLTRNASTFQQQVFAK
ncbi:MAG: hypothetical protein AAGI37_05805 [Planctomycetota bacterium]